MITTFNDSLEDEDICYFTYYDVNFSSRIHKPESSFLKHNFILLGSNIANECCFCKNFEPAMPWERIEIKNSLHQKQYHLNVHTCANCFDSVYKIYSLV